MVPSSQGWKNGVATRLRPTVDGESAINGVVEVLGDLTVRPLEDAVVFMLGHGELETGMLKVRDEESGRQSTSWSALINVMPSESELVAAIVDVAIDGLCCILAFSVSALILGLARLATRLRTLELGLRSIELTRSRCLSPRRNFWISGLCNAFGGLGTPRSNSISGSFGPYRLGEVV